MPSSTATIGRSVLAEAGGMALLTGRALAGAVRSPSKWIASWVEESADLIRRMLFPLALSVFAFGFGVVGMQAGGIIDALGTPDRTGGITVTGSTRELAGWLTAMIVGGVGGTAIAADLGARKTREELDAMSVLGVDIVVTLVAPRMLALVIVTPLLYLIAIVVAVVSSMLATTLLYEPTPAAFTATMAANFTTVDLIAGVVKAVLFGLIIGAVCCFKGISASGGPEGVGRAVNQAVVIAFCLLWIFNYAFTSVLLANFPELIELK